MCLCKPWGQYSRPRYVLPTLLQRSKVFQRSVTKTIAMKLFLIAMACVLSNLLPGCRKHPEHTSIETSLSVNLLMPPFLVGNTPAIAQEIGTPVFPSTDAPIVHFDGPDRAFHVVIGSGKACHVVTLD